MNVAFVIISYHNLIRTTKDENKCNIRNHFLCKGTIVTKKKRKKMVDVHLFDTDAPVIFWRIVFCNTISTTSFATPLQHHFCNIVFCSIASTPPLQHCLNTAFATLSFVVALQHQFCSTVFYNIISTLEW
jgi:hypothetical protein